MPTTASPHRLSPLVIAAIVLVALGAIALAQERTPRDIARDEFAYDPLWASEFAGMLTFTQPSKDAMMGFNLPSEVRHVLVKVGDDVKQGDVLVRARDGDAQAAFRIQQRRSESRLDIALAENRLDLARIEFDNQKMAREQGGGNAVEYERARASLENARIELEIAKERFDEQGMILDRQKAELERYAVIAQFDGTVASIEVSPGQAMQDSQPVLRLVSIDPLHVRLPTPSSTVLGLGLGRGHKAWVAVNVAGQPKLFEGEVIEVSPIADFASDKVWVKVEVPNPEKLMSGLRAWVRFTEPTDGFMRILAEDRPASDGAATTLVGQPR